MKEEVDSAAAFITALLTKHADSEFLEFFRFQLGEELKERYTDHWHIEKPNRGSAYRSINIQYRKIDEKIFEPLTRSFVCVNRMTMQEARLEAAKLSKHLPQELTMWIDPSDVSYRIGDHGSIGVIYSGPSSVTSSENDTSSSANSSARSSPCSSPPPSASPSFDSGLYQPLPTQPLWMPPPLRSSPYNALYLPPQRQCRQEALQQSQNYSHEGLVYW